MANLLPDAERERGSNRALVEFNRGHLVERLKEMGRDYGIRIIEINPFGTSQVCSRCGALGRRYSLIRDPATRLVDIQFGPGEKLFGCSCCGYMANSDHNASVNLHRRFSSGEKAICKYLEWWQLGEKDRAACLHQIEEQIERFLRCFIPASAGLVHSRIQSARSDQLHACVGP